MKKTLNVATIALLLLLTQAKTNAQTVVLNTERKSEKSMYNDPKMTWWKEARFGMFIHWGLYSVPAGMYDGKKVPGIGEWIMNKGKIPVAAYWRAATSSLGAISSILRFIAPCSDKAGATLATMVESASRGSAKPKTLMAPRSEKGRPIWPTPQANESKGTAW